MRLNRKPKPNPIFYEPEKDFFKRLKSLLKRRSGPGEEDQKKILGIENRRLN